MRIMNKEEAIRTYIESMNTDDLREVVRDINSWDGSLDNLAYYNMDEFDELLDGYTPMEIAELVQYGEFNSCNQYFGFDVYGHLVSCSEDELDSEIGMYEDDIVDALLSFDGNLYDDKLQNIVDASDDAIFDEDYEEVSEQA